MEYTWSSFIDEINVNEAYIGLERQKIRKAFEILQKYLGDDFLTEKYMKGHCLSLKLVNFAPWTRQWLIWFSDCLEAVSRFGNFDAIINDFKKPELSRERFLIMRNAYRFEMSGFNVIFEPIIDVNGSRKKPDLLIENSKTQEQIFVEISELNDSDQTREINAMMMNVFMRLIQIRDIVFAGTVHVLLSEESIDELFIRLNVLAEKAKANKIMQELCNDKIHVVLADKDNYDFKEWCGRNGFASDGKSGGLNGPSFNVDEVQRTKHKITQKMKQLSSNNLNMIIVYNNNLFNRGICNQVELNNIEECVYKHDSLLFCSVLSQCIKFGSTTKEINPFKGNRFVSKIADYDFEEGFLAFNRYNNNKVSPNTIARVMDCF